MASDTDPARLIPELLDRLAALGDLARQVIQALGDNGHRVKGWPIAPSEAEDKGG